MEHFLSTCEAAARAGGSVLEKMAGKIRAREKGPADLVTEADLASQATIRERLLGEFPEHGFIGEEAENGDVQPPAIDQTEFSWIVDPLDGTTNYVHGLENYCVSVALRRSHEIIVGTIYDPVRDHCFSAIRGQGARLNGNTIRVSDIGQVREALIATSFAARVSAESDEIRRFQRVLVQCQAIRRLGSAALNLCYVAQGKLDGYWATSVKTWDVAAGILILQEAGGTVTHLDGGPFDLDDPRFIAAAQPELHAELAGLLQLDEAN